MPLICIFLLPMRSGINLVLKTGPAFRLVCSVLLAGFSFLFVLFGPVRLLTARSADSPSAILSDTSATNSGPRIDFNEMVHDFGRVQCGKLVTNFFVFTNTGNQLLEIRDVKT